MKLLIILTILITGSAHAFVSHEDYAISVEMTANKKLKHSRMECKDLEGSGYFSCRLVRLSNSTEPGYEYDYKFVHNYLAKINKTIWSDHQVPELYVKRDNAK